MRISFTDISTKAGTKTKLAFKIFFTAAVLFFVFVKTDLKAVYTNLLSADLRWITVAFVLMAMNMSIQFIKWKTIAETLTGETNKSKLFKSLLFGISAAMITPLQTGVYVGRASVFDKEKIPRALFATFFDKITMLVITAFFGSLVSLWFLNQKYATPNFITVPLLLLVLLLGIFFFAVVSSDKIDNAQLINLFLPGKLSEKFSDKIRYANLIDAGLFWKTLPLFLIQKALLLLQFAVLIVAFGGSGNFFELIAAALLVFFSKSFFPPVTVGDLGVREAMSIFFFGLAGIPAQTAFNAAMLLFVMNLLLPSVFSLYLLARK